MLREYFEHASPCLTRPNTLHRYGNGAYKVFCRDHTTSAIRWNEIAVVQPAKRSNFSAVRCPICALLSSRQHTVRRRRLPCIVDIDSPESLLHPSLLHQSVPTLIPCFARTAAKPYTSKLEVSNRRAGDMDGHVTLIALQLQDASL